MKLLLDENLSDRILPSIVDLFPGSSHIKSHNLLAADDSEIWNFAKTHNLAIVSKDSDFHQRSLLHGAPPKFIFLKIGNGPTRQVIEIIRNAFPLISDFESDPTASILILSPA